MDTSTLCKWTKLKKNSLAILSTGWWRGKKYAYWEKQSTTTNNTVWPCTLSKAFSEIHWNIRPNFCVGNCKGYKNSARCKLEVLFFWQTKHQSINSWLQSFMSTVVYDTNNWGNEWRSDREINFVKTSPSCNDQSAPAFPSFICCHYWNKESVTSISPQMSSKKRLVEWERAIHEPSASSLWGRA